MAELKRCPFCGGKAQLDHAYRGVQVSAYVQCIMCLCKTREFVISTAESCDKKAIEAWNRRVTDGRSD